MSISRKSQAVGSLLVGSVVVVVVVDDGCGVTEEDEEDVHVSVRIQLVGSSEEEKSCC